MIIGCFALQEPFTPMERQFAAIREMGFDYVDLTDNHNGGTLGTEFNFSASTSLDSLPGDIQAMLAKENLTLTSVCAHANLLDPVRGDRYQTPEIVKAIKLAHFLGCKQVITTEGDPRTEFGHNLSESQRLTVIQDKLWEPIQWAKEFDIDLLLEPHGILTDTVTGMKTLLDALSELPNGDLVGVNLDTGNSWLGGGEPLEFIKDKELMSKIKHVHWKDMPEEMIPQRGKLYGCGMGTIPLGDGVVGIEAIVDALLEAGFEGPTTLEVAGVDAVIESGKRLHKWSS